MGALNCGCSGVWVGTRFIASDEAGAGPMHKKRVLEASYEDTLRTIMYSGRPMRIFKTPYSVGTLNLAEVRTQEEIKNGVELSAHERHRRGVFLTGQCAGAITEIKSAKDIIEEMSLQAADSIRASYSLLSSKL